MKLPSIQLPSRPKGLRFNVSSVADPRFVLKAEAGLIEIFDVIGGPGVTDTKVAGALRAIGPNPVVVQINSPGGDPFTGASIYNLLRAHGYPITTQILGIAASAASVVAMAGDRVLIAKNAQTMIHRAQGAAFGDADLMRTVGTLLDQTDEAMAGVYQARTGLKIEQVRALMAAETFMSSDETIELGFADALLDRDAEPAPRSIAASVREIEQHFRDQGVSKSKAARAAAAAMAAIMREKPEFDPAPFLQRIAATQCAIKG
jgi:ATP-dependent Clp protease protease subunit